MVTEIPIITAIVYALIAAYKASVSSEKLIKIIPLIAAILGACLGAASWFAAPQVHAAADIFQAIYHGIVAGLAATGVNQVFKQLSTKVPGNINPES